MAAQNSRVVAILLAGGTGIRFGGADPKQLLSLAGRPVVDYALRTLLTHPAVSEVIVVAPAGRLEAFRELCMQCESEKPWAVIPGGATRAASTKAALELIREQPNCKLLLHDAVRPFVTGRIVDECIAALDAAEGVDVVIETADTIVKLDLREDFVEEVPSRKRLRRGQTPQAFWSHTLLSAYDSLKDADLSGLTDDCGALLRYNADLRIAVVRGDEKNFKITTPIDLFIAEQTLFFFGEEPKTPLVHNIPSNPVAVVFGGTSGLGLATAKQLKEIGWRVRETSRNLGIDVRNPVAVKSFLHKVAKEERKVDVVLNFAGVLKVGALTEMSSIETDEIISTNLTGSVNIAAASFEYLKASRGQLVLVSSSSYYRGRGGSAVYSASKAAVVNLSQALAEEWSPFGIAVSCIVPRRANTPMRRAAFPNEHAGSLLSAEELSEAVQEIILRRQTGIVRHVY